MVYPHTRLAWMFKENFKGFEADVSREDYMMNGASACSYRVTRPQ